MVEADIADTAEDIVDTAVGADTAASAGVGIVDTVVEADTAVDIAASAEEDTAVDTAPVGAGTVDIVVEDIAFDTAFDPAVSVFYATFCLVVDTVVADT